MPASAKVGRSNGASASTPRRSAFRAVNLTRSEPSRKAPAEIAVAAPGLFTPNPAAWVPVTAAPAQRLGPRRRWGPAVRQAPRPTSTASNDPPALGLAALEASRE